MPGHETAGCAVGRVWAAWWRVFVGSVLAVGPPEAMGFEKRGLKEGP